MPVKPPWNPPLEFQKQPWGSEFSDYFETLQKTPWSPKPVAWLIESESQRGYMSIVLARGFWYIQ